MLGTIIARMTGLTRPTETSTSRRPVRRFQAGLNLEGLEGRVVLSSASFNAAMVDGFDGGQRDMITIGLPTNADQEELIETTTIDSNPVDLNPTMPTMDDPPSLIA